MLIYAHKGILMFFPILRESVRTNKNTIIQKYPNIFAGFVGRR